MCIGMAMLAALLIAPSPRKVPQSRVISIH
jgi:hypothetical protein